MTDTAMPGTGRRHRVVAIGLGLGGLIATKALKHDLANITDALVFLTRITAQGTAHVHNRTSLWLQVIPTAAAVLTTIGAVIVLYAATCREPKRTERYEITTAPIHSSCKGWLWRSQHTRKSWC